jgi:hypothetical protein
MKQLGKHAVRNNDLDSDWLSAEYEVADSPFATYNFAVKSLQMLGKKVEFDQVKWLLDYGIGGGFGTKSPDLESTFYCAAVLADSGFKFHKTGKLIDFVQSCQLKSGGFSQIPRGAPAFIESTYFAMSILSLIGMEPKNPKHHISFIQYLQNENGGFRRATEMGISTLSNSYYAVKSLSMLADVIDG